MKDYLVAVVWIALAGCKSSSTSTEAKVASCDLPTLKTCREYRDGNLAMGEDSLEKLCVLSSSAKFASVACPTASVVGSCAKSEGKDFFYEGYAIPVADAEKSCKDSGGTFTRGK